MGMLKNYLPQLSNMWSVPRSKSSMKMYFLAQEVFDIVREMDKEGLCNTASE
jgi:hypothetical protein